MRQMNPEESSEAKSHKQNNFLVKEATNYFAYICFIYSVYIILLIF